MAFATNEILSFLKQKIEDAIPFITIVPSFPQTTNNFPLLVMQLRGEIKPLGMSENLSDRKRYIYKGNVRMILVEKRDRLQDVDIDGATKQLKNEALIFYYIEMLMKRLSYRNKGFSSVYNFSPTINYDHPYFVVEMSLPFYAVYEWREDVDKIEIITWNISWT
jgi:hypothetical protein